MDQLTHPRDVRRLGTVVSRVQEVDHADLSPLSVYLDAGVVPRSDRSDNHNQLGGDLGRYQRVLPGDLVFNRLRTWQGGFGASRHEGIVSPAYIVVRPRGGDARYLDYVLHSAPYLAELTRISKWMPPSQFDILWSDLRGIEVPWPEVEEQQRISDFLDDRVSRIDRIIAARREQMSLVRYEFKSLLELRLDALPDRVRASRMIRVLPGYAFPSAQYSEEPNDVPLLRGVNVGVGALRWEEVVRWPRNQLSEVAQFQLSRGDVVLGMDRPWIGEGLRIAQLQESDGMPLLLQRVAKLIPGDLLNPRFMVRAFQSHSFRTQVESTLTGLSVPHLSGDQILEYSMPYGTRAEQKIISEELDEVDAAATQSTQQLQRSVDLLTEYKSSLITAAATGELDVTTAGSNIPG